MSLIIFGCEPRTKTERFTKAYHHNESGEYEGEGPHGARYIYKDGGIERIYYDDELAKRQQAEQHKEALEACKREQNQGYGGYWSEL